jgi:hypothetical protein
VTKHENVRHNTNLKKVRRLIKNLFQHKNLRIPSDVLKGFTDAFHKSINLEWSKTGKIYEALFYEDELEKIARFDKKGNLIEIRTNISPSSLPEPAKTAAASIGEIMNVIFINKADKIFYEVIVRENPVVRILLLISVNAEILSRKIL